MQYIVNFSLKMFDIFLFCVQNIDCGYMLEPPRQGDPTDYPKSMLWIKNKTMGIPLWHQIPQTLAMISKCGSEDIIRRVYSAKSIIIKFSSNNIFDHVIKYVKVKPRSPFVKHTKAIKRLKHDYLECKSKLNAAYPLWIATMLF